MNLKFNLSESLRPTVDFPEPHTPIKIIIIYILQKNVYTLIMKPYWILNF